MDDSKDVGPRAPSLIEVQRRVREYWERTGVPASALSANADGPVFRFTEGPPTANGVPHIGHVFARTLKDVHLRFHRMLGERIISPIGGWDCHGLPVELEVEKRLGLRSKKEIETYGVAKFCEECRRSALEVVDVWREMSQRLGFWLDYDRAYYTMNPQFIESVWWSLKELHKKGLLEKGHYSLPYCPRCETPLSSHEVAQGYRTTTDPSITVRFELAKRAPSGSRQFLLVWTTTPWTLPANLLIAARADLEYVAVRLPDGSDGILAPEAVDRTFPSKLEVLRRFSGRELEGLGYTPLWPYAGPGQGRYQVVLDPMVDSTEGTGLVHIAPTFGPEDQRIGARERVGFFDPLDSRAVFTDRVPPVAGRPFKAADSILLQDLQDRGAVVQSSTLQHTYPFCWRCGNPLIYRAIDAWFVRTSRFNEALVGNNQKVNWVPSHLRDGRFGNFLTEAKDWALSRNRYWGTPLPVWLCGRQHSTVVGSFAELAQLSGSPLPPDFDPHRTGVDGIRFPCPDCGDVAQREPYTIDGWYDSGSAPFAEFHYPFEKSEFETAEPLDFVAEGLDQTRGWFYTMLVLSTALFDRPAYLNVVVNGLALDESGQKMAKSKGNVTDPMQLLDRLGGDAVRWGFLLTDYTEPVRVDEQGLARAGQRGLGTLLNVLHFYLENARVVGRPPAAQPPPTVSVLDRWLLSRLDATETTVRSAVTGYDPRRAVQSLRSLVDDLSTWYLRRSRDRFWSDESSSDRDSAFDVLSFVLGRLALVLAPFAPFTAEYVHHELGGLGWNSASDSVHLRAFPTALKMRESAVEEAMADLRSWVEVGRELRQRAGVKGRVPLEEFVVVSPTAPLFQTLGPEGIGLLSDELNVRTIRIAAPAEGAALDEKVYVVRIEERGPRAALARVPSPELRREGLVRETLRRLQHLRKEMRLDYTDRVEVDWWASGELASALESAKEEVARQVLADRLSMSLAPDAVGSGSHEFDILGEALRVRLVRVGSTREGAVGAR